jgi:peptidoglycan/LPS O-acetylase OafA/YrhL
MNSQRSNLLRPYYPALDGLRAIAFLAVFLFHYGWGTIPIPGINYVVKWGWTGVDLFFVLSGFLITGILYDTVHSERFFRNFYIRRALRIFPLFYGIWIAALLLTPILHIEWNRYNAAFTGYFGNFFLVGAELHHHADPGVLLLPPGHTGGGPRGLWIGQFWSLCVEEQFYMVWPAVVWLVRSRVALLRISLGIVVAVLTLRVGYAHYHPDLVRLGACYFSTPFRVDSLFVGAAISLWLRDTTMPARSLRLIAYATAVGAPVLFVIGWLMTGPHNAHDFRDVYVDTYGFTLIAITAGAIIVLAIDSATRVARALQQHALSFLGRISYGMYALHLIPAMFLGIAAGRLIPYHLQFVVPIFALVGTAGAAWLSFRYLESPFLRLKSVLAPQPTTPWVPSAAGAAEKPKSLPQAHTVYRPAA